MRLHALTSAVLALALGFALANKSPDGSIDCGEWLYTEECPKERPCYTVHGVDPVTGASHRCTTPPVIDFQPTCKLPQPLWTAVDTSPGESMSFGMTADTVSGDVWIAGTFRDRMKLTKEGSGGTGGVELSTSVANDDDMYIMGITPDGHHLKHWVFSGEGSQTLIETAFQNNKLAIVGYQTALSDAHPADIQFPIIGGATKQCTNAKTKDASAFVAVVDTTQATETAAVVWAACIQNQSDTRLYSTDIDAAGNVAVVGHTCAEDSSGHSDPFDVNCGAFTYSTQCPMETPCYTGNDADPATGKTHVCVAASSIPSKPSRCDAIVALYPPTGGTPKSIIIPALVHHEDFSLRRIKFDGAGTSQSILVTGRIKGTDIDFGGPCGRRSSVSHFRSSVLVASFDSKLVCKWVQVFGAEGDWGQGDFGLDLVSLGDHMYVVGGSQGQGDRQGMWQGSNTGFLLKLRKADGTAVWGSDIPQARSIDIAQTGDFVYVLGYYSGNAIFHVGGSPHLSLHSKGGLDIFIGKVQTHTGKGAWAMDFGGSEVDYPWKLELDKNGDIFVSGLTQSPEVTYGQDSGKASSIKGESKMFVTKLDKAETMPSCLSSCTEVKSGNCFIHNKCYEQKAPSPYEGLSCLKCNSEEDQRSWVHDSDEGCYIDHQCVAKGEYRTLQSGAKSVCQICDAEKNADEWEVLDGFAVVGWEGCVSSEAVECGIIGHPSVWCSGRHPCLDLEDGVCKTAPACFDGATYDEKSCDLTTPCYKDGRCENAFPTFPDCGDYTFEPLGCKDRCNQWNSESGTLNPES
mmetsp:Transcript_33166/g.51643  ORF Transcript_33166/g.51643 Transcript_33166/m.51643 type:complete len:799 (-) Transcript_33166:2371-4767(-)